MYFSSMKTNHRTCKLFHVWYTNFNFKGRITEVFGLPMLYLHLKAFRTDLQPPSEVGSEDPGEHPQANATLVLSSQT